MSISKIKELLNPWVSVDTWSTGHPMDDKRFHKALFSIFSELGTNIDGVDFSEAIYELVDERHPKLEDKYKESKVQDYAIRAENIASYLNDIK